MGESFKEVEINKKHFEKAYIAGAIEEADSMIVLSHLKGHEMAGFGGAVKNLAMGCTNPHGKKRTAFNPPRCGSCKMYCLWSLRESVS